MKLVNVMEQLVMDCINHNIDSINCCSCEQCRADIAAFVLNRIPPKYVATETGELYSKVNNMNQPMETEIMVEVIKAAEIVKEKPRHKKNTDN